MIPSLQLRSMMIHPAARASGHDALAVRSSPRRPLVLVLLLASVGCQKTPPPVPSLPLSSDQPELAYTLEPREIDVGVCRLGELRYFRALITNNGTSTLKINDIRPTCACTDVTVSAAECPPHQRIALSGKIRTDIKEGSFRHNVKLDVTTPDEDIINLDIVGSSASAISLSPGELTLVPDYFHSKSDSRRVRVRNGTGAALKITISQQLPPGISAQVSKPTLAPEEETTIEVTAAPTIVATAGREITILTTDPIEHQRVLTVNVAPADAIAVFPSSLRLGVLSAEDLRSKNRLRFSLTGAHLAELQLKEVLLPSFFQSYRILDTNGKSLSIQMSLKEGLDQIDLSGQVTLVIGMRGREFTINVPVSGILSQPSPSTKE